MTENFFGLRCSMDQRHVIAALGGVAAGIILCKMLKKEPYEDMWAVPNAIAAPVNNVQGVNVPDVGPNFEPLNPPAPTTYAPSGADFLLMDNALDMTTAVPFNPISPFVV